MSTHQEARVKFSNLTLKKDECKWIQQARCYQTLNSGLAENNIPAVGNGDDANSRNTDGDVNRVKIEQQESLEFAVWQFLHEELTEVNDQRRNNQGP
jgi:hypothetical protein